jgi:hypothetical protein
LELKKKRLELLVTDIKIKEAMAGKIPESEKASDMKKYGIWAAIAAVAGLIGHFL